MTLVQFREYRDYAQNRQEANNAIMALLAGSQLANHVLHLTHGSEMQLSQIFPAVPHIKRFNLRTDRAQQFLGEAEEHLCAMAVPYILAIHEDLLMTTLKMLARDGHMTMRRADDAKSHNMHSTFESVTGHTLPAASVKQFHLLRFMRNCLIHAAGTANQALVGHIASLDAPTIQGWETLTGHPLMGSVTVGRKVSFKQGDLIASLAVTKRIAEECNSALVGKISRQTWADYVLREFQADGGNSQANDRLRKVKGIARFYYRALQLTEQELQDAIARA
ncbi:hypothetical protein JOD64_003154 [Micromonospora luteifusca]|uniref:Uncharacterized protein n=1 Tax=Micromonospora luteifusca TaxID=709860 RepID=A0ABS2LVE5_9ACTN|nr:hypothetical protein [Micromonospora luteifusca]MBM7491932.1 hypothetical protein [Micromonospora luteifusca]